MIATPPLTTTDPPGRLFRHSASSSPVDHNLPSIVPGTDYQAVVASGPSLLRVELDELSPDAVSSLLFVEHCYEFYADLLRRPARAAKAKLAISYRLSTAKLEVWQDSGGGPRLKLSLPFRSEHHHSIRALLNSGELLWTFDFDRELEQVVIQARPNV